MQHIRLLLSPASPMSWNIKWCWQEHIPDGDEITSISRTIAVRDATARDAATHAR